MTKQEFILCCSLFEKYFKGKSLKDILNDDGFVEYKLEQPIYDFSDQPRFGTYNCESNNASLRRLRRNVDCIMFFRNGILKLNEYGNSENSSHKTIDGFLNLFNIPFEDII